MKYILLFAFCTPFFINAQVKNVILLIGDGMGVSQVSTAFYYNDGKPTNFQRFPVVGLINTSSAKQKVTDSAAGATAFACGKRSYNGAISVDTLGANLPNLTEVLKDTKVKTGLVATSSITHATPAAFYAHAKSRKEEESIALQLVNANVDFFAGGGLQFFNRRTDKKNVFKQLESAGFLMDTTALSFSAMDATKKYGYLLAQKGMPSKVNGRDDFLPNATKLALNYLEQSPEGFFLMVEGSQIDWEGHAKNSQGIIEEVKDFDKTIGAALDFAERNKNTLVIVTADHETGGYALTPKIENGKADYSQVEPRFYKGAEEQESASHTATLIPVFAYGPHSQLFSGIYLNNEIFHKIRQATGW